MIWSFDHSIHLIIVFLDDTKKFVFVRFQWKNCRVRVRRFEDFFFLSWEKKVEIFCWNAVEREPVPTIVLISEGCGVQGSSPGVGCGEANPITHKKNCRLNFFQTFFRKIIFFFPKLFFSQNRLKRTQKNIHWNRTEIFFWFRP